MKKYIVLQPTGSGAIICHIRAKENFAKEIAMKYHGAYIKDIVSDELNNEEFRAFRSFCAFCTQDPNNIDVADRAAKQIITQLRANSHK